jgi:hypothetical protein
VVGDFGPVLTTPSRDLFSFGSGKCPLATPTYKRLRPHIQRKGSFCVPYLGPSIGASLSKRLFMDRPSFAALNSESVSCRRSSIGEERLCTII